MLMARPSSQARRAASSERWARASSSLVDVGHMAAFIACDQAAAMTASAANITCGAVPD